MKISRAPAVAALARLVAITCGLAAASSFGQTFPSKPIRNILSISGGGENTARLISEKAAETLGVPILVEAQSGAGGAVAVMNTARAAPDGYTIMYSTSQTIVLRPFLVKDNPYVSLRDLTPIAQVGETTYAIAASLHLPVTTLSALIEYAKKNPGKVSYASTGIGTTGHLSGALIEQMAGIQMVHVPYKGGTQSVPDLLGGRVLLSFTTMSTFTPLVQTGKLRILAVSQDKRYERMPEVPTVAEVLPGYEVPPGWFGYFGPVGLPPAVLKRLSDAIIRGANRPEVVSRLAEVGVTIHTRTSEEYAEYIKRNNEVTAKIMKAAGVQPE